MGKKIGFSTTNGQIPPQLYFFSQFKMLFEKIVLSFEKIVQSVFSFKH